MNTTVSLFVLTLIAVGSFFLLNFLIRQYKGRDLEKDAPDTEPTPKHDDVKALSKSFVVMSVSILMLIAGGALTLLDYYITQDEAENTSQSRKFLQQVRDTAIARTEAKKQFESQLDVNLANCQETAVKINDDYVGLILKAAPRKRGQPEISNDILDEASILLSNAKAECQKVHDERLIAGF